MITSENVGTEGLGSRLATTELATRRGRDSKLKGTVASHNKRMKKFQGKFLKKQSSS